MAPASEPPTLSVRFATLDDIVPVASVLIEAMRSVEIFQFIYETRSKEYPEDHRSRWEHRLRGYILDPNQALLIAETTPSPPRSASPQPPKIVGVSVWTLHGPCTEVRQTLAVAQRQIGWMPFLLHSLSTYYRSWSLWFSPLRDEIPARRTEWLKLHERLDEEYYKPLPESYHLEILCTSESARRTGAATEMVQWFIDRAKPTRIPVGVESSMMGIPFYEKLGFRKIDDLYLTYPDEPDREKVRLPVYRYHYD